MKTQSNNVRRVLLTIPKGSVKTLEDVCKALGGAFISSEGGSKSPTVDSWESLCSYIEQKGFNPLELITSMLNVSKEGTFAFLINLIYKANSTESKEPSEGTVKEFITSQEIILANISHYQEILGEEFLTLLSESKGK